MLSCAHCFDVWVCIACDCHLWVSFVHHRLPYHTATACLLHVLEITLDRPLNKSTNHNQQITDTRVVNRSKNVQPEQFTPSTRQRQCTRSEALTRAASCSDDINRFELCIWTAMLLAAVGCVRMADGWVSSWLVVHAAGERQKFGHAPVSAVKRIAKLQYHLPAWRSCWRASACAGVHVESGIGTSCQQSTRHLRRVQYAMRLRASVRPIRATTPSQ